MKDSVRNEFFILWFVWVNCKQEIDRVGQVARKQRNDCYCYDKQVTNDNMFMKMIRGKDWNQPSRSCKGETTPYSGTSYPAGIPQSWVVVNKVLSRIKKPVYLLDITYLSQLRKEAHPSVYSGQHSGTDCSHWCLPGLPDTWNDLFYGALFG